MTETMTEYKYGNTTTEDEIEPWKLTIERTSNGYIVTTYDGKSIVLEDKDTEWGELESMHNLLWEVMEYFGVYYSKHRAKNIVVNIEDNDEEK